MASKKKITRESVVSAYMDYVLEHGENPASMHSFGKSLTVDESEIYTLFGSFEAMEKAVFSQFYTRTVDLLAASKDYASYDSRNKMLSFYFTFFDLLTANRSYVLHSLSGAPMHLPELKKLSELKALFTTYVGQLGIEPVKWKDHRLDKTQRSAVKHSAWLQLLSILKFWMDDGSPNFEKSDLFIEKSVHAAFDMIEVTPLKSMVDLGKFLFKERMSPA